MIAVFHIAFLDGDEVGPSTGERTHGELASHAVGVGESTHPQNMGQDPDNVMLIHWSWAGH
jgi:hypothetical protein